MLNVRTLPGAIAPVLRLAVASLFLQGCIFVPVRTAPDEAQCPASRMALRLEYVQGFEQCSGEGCMAVVALMGITALSSAILSGSIVLVNNALYGHHHGEACPSRPPGTL